jgi:hypothetical protein
MIDEQRALLHGAESAFASHRHSEKVIIIAHACDDDVRALRRLGRSSGNRTSMLARPRLRLGRGAIENRKLMPGFRQMSCNRPAHYAEADKRYVCHIWRIDFLRQQA